MLSKTNADAVAAGSQRRGLFLKSAHLIGVFLALLLAIPTLHYPFSRDQACYWYVGKAWSEGILPYIGAFDHKPPGIYFVYRLLYGAFGDEQWPIRAAEILAIPLIAFFIAKLVARANGTPTRAPIGTAAILAAAFYFIPFSFRETGTVEYWEGFFLLAALYVALCNARIPATILGGLFVAAACLFKFTAVIPGLLTLGILLYRARAAGLKGVIKALGLFLASGLALTTMITLPFLLEGHFKTVWESIFTFNLHYALNMNIRLLSPAELLLDHILPFTTLPVLSTLLLVLLPQNPTLRRLWQLLTAHTLLVLVSVAIQRGIVMHYTVLSVYFALPVVGLLHYLEHRSKEAQMHSIVSAVVVAAFLMVCAPNWLGNEDMNYPRYYAHWLDKKVGPNQNAKEYNQVFKSVWGFNYADIRQVGGLISQHAESKDTLCVWDYEPGIYHSSGLTCPSRFFSPHFFLHKGMQFQYKTWLQEHYKALNQAPPRFIALRVYQTGDIRRLLGSGYETLGVAGATQVLVQGRAED